jgi:hypothetical protein
LRDALETGRLFFVSRRLNGVIVRRAAPAFRPLHPAHAKKTFVSPSQGHGRAFIRRTRVKKQKKV